MSETTKKFLVRWWIKPDADAKAIQHQHRYDTREVAEQELMSCAVLPNIVKACVIEEVTTETVVQHFEREGLAPGAPGEVTYP